MNSKSTVPPATRETVHVLVVIDHRMARIYKAELQGTALQCIIPYDANGAGRHLHYVENEYSDQRKPERRSFYHGIAKTLQNAEKIVLFGSDTEATSPMTQLLTELKRNYDDVAKRIVASIVVDEEHLTEIQLLAKARDFFSSQKTTQQRDIHETCN